MRLEGARTSSTPTATEVRFCWNSMPRSIVTSASYLPPMRLRSSPFVMPVQPRYRHGGLGAQRQGLAAAARQRRTRTSQQRSAREVERRDRLVASHGRELAKKLVQGLAAFEVIEQRLYRNTCADEHRRAPEDVRVSAHDVA